MAILIWGIHEGRKREAPRRPPEAEHRAPVTTPLPAEPARRPVDVRDVDRTLIRAAQQAGGDDVWVKGLVADSSDDSGTESETDHDGRVIEAVATPGAYHAVLSAIEAEAQRQGLDVRSSDAVTKGAGPAEQIEVLRNRQAVRRWQVRQVPRLYRAAIVIDDLGGDLPAAEKLLRLPYGLTFSVLPYLAHSAMVAEEVHRDGREVMLHLPMEAEPGSLVALGRGAIKVGMTGPEIADAIEGDLASVPYVRGTNNHMGSRATADPRLMAEVMRTLANRHLYFIDSRTTTSTVAYDAARQEGVPTFFRSVFLDDKQDTAYSLQQLETFRRIIEQRGAALAIGHPHPTTIEALAKFLPELERDDVELVPPSELVRLPEVARILPPRKPAP
ncbi:MAG: divergent polysaccharide deacetylase family protein [Terriglobia bacterium]